MEGAVPAHQLGLLATARSMLLWHARHGFCANCGTRTVMAAAGFRRECPSCGAHHFPRTDPVVIMLVTRGDARLDNKKTKAAFGWPVQNWTVTPRMFTVLGSSLTRPAASGLAARLFFY